jgi:hypothetical protein
MALLFSSMACYTMRPMSVDDLKGESVPRVWVTRSDQSVVLVEGPQLFRGKLVGFVDGTYRELPPADLTQLVVRKLALGRTLALLSAGALGFTVAAVALAGNGADSDPCVGDEDCVDQQLRVASP